MSAAAAVTPREMPGAVCGRVTGSTGLYRCVRKAGHGGNCTPMRRDDLDLVEDAAEVAPQPLDELLEAQAIAGRNLLRAVETPTPADVETTASARWSAPHGLAEQLDVAAKALRWSAQLGLAPGERRHARALARSVVGRIDRELSPPPPNT